MQFLVDCCYFFFKWKIIFMASLLWILEWDKKKRNLNKYYTVISFIVIPLFLMKKKNKFKECVQLNGINMQKQIHLFTVTDGIFFVFKFIEHNHYYFVLCTSKEMEEIEREEDFFRCLLIVKLSCDRIWSFWRICFCCCCFCCCNAENDIRKICIRKTHKCNYQIEFIVFIYLFNFFYIFADFQAKFNWFWTKKREYNAHTHTPFDK